VILRGHRPPPPWRRAVLLGLFEPALAYAGDLLGVARTSAANDALLSGLESVFIVLLAAVFLRSLTVARVLGAILIGLSVTIFTATELAAARNAAQANVTPSEV
jgi:drug/metabolite transporter (DMT)-like permease